MSKNKIKIGFTGDIAFDEYTTDYYNKPEKIDKKLLDFLNDNDYNVIDLESPVTLHDETEKKRYNGCSHRRNTVFRRHPSRHGRTCKGVYESGNGCCKCGRYCRYA